MNKQGTHPRDAAQRKDHVSASLEEGMPSALSLTVAPACQGSGSSLSALPYHADVPTNAPMLTSSTRDSSCAYMAQASVGLQDMDEDLFLAQSIVLHGPDSSPETTKDRRWSSSTDSTRRSSSLNESFLHKIPVFEGVRESVDAAPAHPANSASSYEAVARGTSQPAVSPASPTPFTSERFQALSKTLTSYTPTEKERELQTRIAKLGDH